MTGPDLPDRSPAGDQGDQQPPSAGGVPPRPTPLPAARASGAKTASGTGLGGYVSGPDASAAHRPAPARPGPGVRPFTKARKARLAVRRLDPWSVFVTSLMLSLFFAVVTLVAGLVLYQILDALGIPASINKGLTETLTRDPVLTRGRFLGGTALLAALNIVFLTAFATLGSMLYNVCASFTGGLEITLAERD